MVGNYAHGNVCFLRITVFNLAEFAYFFNDGLKNIGVIVRCFALNGHAKALKTHSGINYLSGKFFERTIGFAVELHEYVVPDFNDLRMALVHQTKSVDFGTLTIGADIDMYFGTRTAGTCVTHFPKIIFLITVNNAVCRQKLRPDFGSFVVTFQFFVFRTLKNGNIQAVFVQFQHFSQVFPCPGDGFFLEIITERPVAEHFEHGVVIGVMSHFFQVVVLAAYTQAFLRVGHAGIFYWVITENNIFELVHSRIGEHQRWVIFYNHGCRRYNFMPV